MRDVYIQDALEPRDDLRIGVSARSPGYGFVEIVDGTTHAPEGVAYLDDPTTAVAYLDAAGLTRLAEAALKVARKLPPVSAE